MCDFSKYGGKSAEWLALEPTLPQRPEMSMEALRKSINNNREATSAQAMHSLAPKVIMQDHNVPTRDGDKIALRTYRPADREQSQLLPIYIHFHEGGFFFGTLASEDAECARIAIDVGALAVNVNYRHVPAHPFPAPYDDSEDALDWVISHAGDLGGDVNRIVVGGMSAGGALTAALTQTVQRRGSSFKPRILGQVLMIPTVVLETYSAPFLARLADPSRSSYVENELAPILPMARVRQFMELLHRTSPGAEDRRANPGLATEEELKNLPPAVVSVCGLDPLRDEGLLYAKLLHENGVPTQVNIFKGVPHGYTTHGDKLTASKAWQQVVHDGIRWALSRPSLPASQKYHVYEDSTEAVIE